MADENESLREEMERLRESTQNLGDATSTASAKLKDFSSSAVKGIGNFTKTVGQGDTTFKSLNNIVDITANAMAGLAKSIPWAGNAVAAGLKATAEASKFMLDQLDQSTKAFNQLSKVGALTAEGMSGLQKQFTTSGLQLKTFQKQVGDNAVALARFRGMTGEGAQAFSEIAGKLTRGGDDSLRRLGMSADDIGESVGAFVTQQTRLGRAQNQSNAQLAEGAKRYAIELDELSKVTGQSRESLQKQQDQALSESRFRASINSLNKDQQDGLLKLQSVMSGFGAELGQGTRDLVSGAANTEAARKLMVDTGGAAQDIISRLKAGQIDATQAQLEMQQAVRANLKAGEQYSKFVDQSSSVMGNFANKADFASAKFDASGKLAKEVQTQQINGQDKLTTQTVEAQKSMEGLNIEIQKLGFTFLPEASTAVKSMTGAMEQFVKYVNNTINKTPSASTQPAGTGPTPAPATTAGGSAVGGMHGTRRRQTVTSPGTAQKSQAPSGPAGAPARSNTSGEPGGSSTGTSPDKWLKGASVTGVDEVLVAALAMAAADLGRPITVTSGKRSLDEQQKLYDAYISGRSKIPAAPPGKSKHHEGNAVDINTSDAEALASMGLLEKYGLKRPVKNDPVHIVSAKNGFDGMLSGPTSGYQPNLTMHGTEKLSITPTTGPNADTGNGDKTEIMTAQLAKLDELVSVMKTQLGVSQKLLSYSS